jgi:hypothetical protein
MRVLSRPRSRLGNGAAGVLRVPVAAVLLLLAVAVPSSAQVSSPPADSVAALLTRLEQVVRDGSPERYLDLLAQSALRQSARAFAEVWIVPGATRAVVRERDRLPLAGTLPGDGYSLLVEAFVEFGSRARLATWRLDVRRGPTADPGDWRIASQQVLSMLQGLFRLTLNPRRQVAVKDAVVSAEDMTLTVPDGTMFVAEAEGEPTAVVLLGRGDLAFAPAPQAERSQLRVVTGAETLQSPTDAVFLRVHPDSVKTFLSAREMVDRPSVDPRDFKRAEDIFRQDVARSYSLDLGDLSADLWSLLPMAGDVIAEIRTRRFETLTFVKSGTEVEDISLFDRKNRRNLSVYQSRAHLAKFTRFYNDEDRADYVVHAYELDVRFDPPKRRLDGLAKLAVEVTAPSINSFTLKLSDALEVKAITSRELGRLLSVRVRGQDSVVVNLPATLVRGFRLNLEVLYGGRLEPQSLDRETIQVSAPQQEQQQDDFEMPLEESFLFSNRSYWYPQAAVLGYSTAEIRVTLAEPWVALSSGQLVSATLAPGPVERGVRRREFTFAARQPVRYLALLVARLVEARREKLALHGGEVELRVLANARQAGRGKDLAKTATSILKFYTSLVGEVPYADLTVAAVEQRLPGGHSPAHLVVLAVQGPGPALRWSEDPGALPFPEFFIAHEVAHQWWGQAVGWKNYHEQWISEGFAQYFAALYAERAHGPAAFNAVLRRMQGWAVDQSDQGAIFLGYRVGHAKGESRLFRAVVYNKGAMVLHMLRGLVGDEAFFTGLKRFYTTWHYKKAGTDDFRRSMEEASGRDLGRFFEQWVIGDGVPQLSYSWRVENRPGVPEVVIRFEQAGDPYQLPVTVTLDYDNNRSSDSVVKLTEKVVEVRLPLTGTLRRLDVNRDHGAVAVFKQAPGGG